MGAVPVPPFVISEKGDFGQVNYDIRRITPQQWDKVKTEFVAFLNKLESFAIPFAAGVADDDTGFMEAAAAFILSLNIFMLAIYYLRTTQGVRYGSVLKHLDSSPRNRTSHAGDAENGRGLQK